METTIAAPIVSRSLRTRRRAAAVLEVLSVYLVGPLVAAGVSRVLGLRLVNPMQTFTVDIGDAQLITASGQMFALLVMQYIGYFLLIVPINWWHRRRGPGAYGLTKGGLSWRRLLLAGVGTVAVTVLLVWPVSTLLLVDSVYHLHLGGTVPWREALFATSWRRWEFWLFTAVMSWALIPFVEELLFRGYCQRRLAEDWGNGPAIIGTAFLFTVTHGQYLTPSAYNACMVVSLLLLAIAFGTVFAWTGSLIPAIVAHAIINVPLTPPGQLAFLVTFLAGGIVVRRRGIAAVRKVFSNANLATCLALGSVGTVWAIAGQRLALLIYVACAMLVVAVALERREVAPR